MKTELEKDLLRESVSKRLTFENSGEQYRLLFERSPYPMWVFNEQTLAFMTVNEAAISHYGYSREEFLGMTLKDIRPAEDVPVLLKWIDQGMAEPPGNGIWRSILWKHRKKNGTMIDVQSARSRIIFQGERAVLVLAEDVTSRELFRKNLIQAQEELEHRVRERSLHLLKANSHLQLEIKERKRVEHLNAAFSKLGRRLNSATSPKAASRIIIQVADNLLGWDSCFLALYGKRNQVHRLLNMDIVDGRRQEVPAIVDARSKPTPTIQRALKGVPQLILRKPPFKSTGGFQVFGDKSRPSASLMFVPIHKGGEVIGILSIQSYTVRAYDKTDLTTLQSLADYCGGALERIFAQMALRESEVREKRALAAKNAELKSEIFKRQRLEKRALALSQLGRSLSAATSPQIAARIIIRVADELIGWDGCYLHLYSESDKHVYRVLNIDTFQDGRRRFVHTGKSRILSPSLKKVLKDGPQLILRRKAVFDSRTEPFGDYSRPSASLMFVPMRNNERVTGFISIQSYTLKAYDKQDLELLQVLADHCGGALERLLTEKALRENESQKRTMLAAANRKLEKEIYQRKRLEKELLESTDHERRRIGEDLHDDLGQQLTGVLFLTRGLELKLPSKSEARLEAKKIHGLVRKMIQRARGLAQGLTLIQLEGTDLPSALHDLSARIKSVFEIPCHCRVRGKIPKLNDQTVQQLHNIAQEAATNAIKHGRAREIQIDLQTTKENLVLTVKNEGKPFNLCEVKSGGIGLRIMNYRASVIGAELKVEITPRQETLFSCVLPLPK